MIHSFVLKLLEEATQVVSLELEELLFLRNSSLVDGAALLSTGPVGLDPLLKLKDFVLHPNLLVFELFNLGL